ncbi:HPP family protein [Acidovorax sp.]|uniref:HPP family protein n=1 Tax=Acidovorax sp. TaxID=1872122 RepID=UPI002585E788|nr:HPP family protein [Acidovorax sp.]
MRWLRRFWPAPVGIDGRERLRVVAGVSLGVLIAALLSRWWAIGHAGPWMVGSLGASAILVFGMPSSPLAQPWPVLGGSTLSALVGGVCAALVPDPAVAGALAVGLSMALMVPLRCLHPPGGAMALYVVIAQGNGLQLAAFPICFNALVLVVLGVAYNTLTGRQYPHSQRWREPAGPPQSGPFAASDVDAALSHYNQLLDVSREDLEGLLHLAGRAAFQRTLGDLRCSDVMSKPPLAVEAGVSLKDAWALMRSQQVKALPVVDAHRLVVGIVTVADFMRLANLDMHEGLGQRLRTLVMGRSGQPASVGEIMSHPVQVIGEQQHAMDLVPLFSQGGHHHIPVVDTRQQLVGIITQTDLVRTLAGALQIPQVAGSTPAG